MISTTVPKRSAPFSILVPLHGGGALQAARPVEAYSSRYAILSAPCCYLPQQSKALQQGGVLSTRQGLCRATSSDRCETNLTSTPKRPSFLPPFLRSRRREALTALFSPMMQGANCPFLFESSSSAKWSVHLSPSRPFQAFDAKCRRDRPRGYDISHNHRRRPRKFHAGSV